VTVTDLVREGETDTSIQHYRFAFDPGGSIDQPETAILEPMLVHVLGGSFIFYIPEAAGGIISFRGGELPYAVDLMPTDECSSLPPEGAQTCTFSDQPSATEQFTCVQSSTGYDCDVLNTAGILVQPGTTLVLPGPTECMVCKLDADPGILEVAVVAPPGESVWRNAVPSSDLEATPQPVDGLDATPAAKQALTTARPPVSLVDPCDGLVR